MAAKTTPHSGHRARMRKRFLATGGKEFSDHELLEMLLYYVTPRANTNPTAHALLNGAAGLDTQSADAPKRRRGPLEALCGLSADRLEQLTGDIPGCPTALPQLLDALKEFEACYLADKCDAYVGRTNINDARSVTRYALDLCANEPEEVTWLLCVDNRMSVKCCLPLCLGRPTGDRLFVEAMRMAVSRSVSCVMLVCNHNDGNPAFTKEELSTSRRLFADLRQGGVRLLDVVLCCDGNISRLSTTGLLTGETEVSVW
ncbi:MAG: hypothetical protein IJC25_06350 [Clostridia bacterium]|nr:hypothetical protein [Clostridia bacterium]